MVCMRIRPEHFLGVGEEDSEVFRLLGVGRAFPIIIDPVELVLFAIRYQIVDKGLPKSSRGCHSREGSRAATTPDTYEYSAAILVASTRGRSDVSSRDAACGQPARVSRIDREKN